MSLACKLVELMAIILARDISDGEKGAAGIAAVPNAAIFLHRRLHALNFSICGELVVNPKPKRLYASVSITATTMEQKPRKGFWNFWQLPQRSRFLVSQRHSIDKYGNVNLHLLGA